MEKENIATMKKMALVLLAASGANVVPPAELKEQAIDALELGEDSKFDQIESIFNCTKDQSKKLNYIRALILTQLKPSEMMSLHEDIHVGVEAIIHYVSDHPECRNTDSSIEEIFDIE